MKSSAMQNDWYVVHNGSHYGPVSLKDLRNEAKLGRLHPRDDLLWRNGFTSWVHAGSLEVVVSDFVYLSPEKPETTNKTNTFLDSLLLCLSVIIFFLGAAFFVLSVALPRGHGVRIALHEVMANAESVWQKR